VVRAVTKAPIPKKAMTRPGMKNSIKIKNNPTMVQVTSGGMDDKNVILFSFST
jgi:hypothetical protein